MCGSVTSYTQITNQELANDSLQLNTITTAVPFLMIAPDSRAGAMGDAGVASSPDASSIHWNPSKLAFIDKEMGFSISYTPWLRDLVPDINLSYVSGYKKIDKDQALAMSLTYFSLGEITFTNQTGQQYAQFRPNEFAVDIAYARKLADNFSGGIALRYIYSNLTGNFNVQGADTRPGRAVAADVSGYYTNDKASVGDKDANWSAGINISNIGSKMSYTRSADKDFIPINLRLGQSLEIDLDDYNSITLHTDFNKLLVPTPPRYKLDSTGQPVLGPGGNYVIQDGRDPNVSVASGMFGSFTDAPGGFREELREVNLSMGFEYWYDRQFAARFGYFYEHPTKGDRQYFTIGAGLRLSVFGIDFSYLVATQPNNPLANTVRFSLTFDFDAFKEQQKNKAGG